MMAAQTSTQATSRQERLSWRTKLAYGIGNLGSSVGPGTVIPFWYLYFLTDVAKLNPALAGLSLLIGKIWDSVNDPLVGTLTDRTRTRWGRRRPYLLFGAVPFGVTFALLWIVPPIQNQLLLCLYFALMYILFDTAHTFVSCPYIALTPELTLDHDERTSLVTYRVAVSIASGLLAAFLIGQVLFPLFPDEREAFLAIGLGCGAFFTPPLFITFLGTREREEFQAKQALSFLQGLRYVLRNRAWRYAISVRLLSWMPVDIASAVFPYFLIYWIGMEEGGAMMVLATILASSILFLPFLLWLSKRMEKKWAFILATSSWVVVMLAILLVPQGARRLAYVLAFAAGLGVSSAHLLPNAMIPDVLEADELMSGRRQEGIYAGFDVFIRKLSTGLVLSMIGPILAWSGYEEGAAQQAPQVLTAIRLMIALMPSILLIASILIAWAYPITRNRHAEMREELERRRAETPS
ncbi:MAG: glycoside-pentoside-hexuronide (GPH):cation symporter [Chloroflexota bacterium]|nr:glycoside-pentoside-hexuronide (GPH):cation symporter [Chloroflexota bacterium]